jgi:integral membrane sensor domain MASE1
MAGIAKRGGLTLVASVAAIALVYFAAAKLGLALAFETPSVTAIWPPTGIALAALVLGGRRLWPGVALGAFLANVTTDVPLYTTLGITLGNTLEALVGATLLKRFGFRPQLDRLRDLFALVLLAGMLSTSISATIGVASLALGDSLSTDALSTWRVWWLGDMGGDLLVATFLFAAVSHWPYRDVPGRPLEALGLAVVLVGTALLAFSQPRSVAYLIFPFLIWAALRFLQPGATAAALITAAIAVAFTAEGSGEFVELSEDDSLLLAQTFCAVAGLTALVLAIATSERRRAERSAGEIAHALQAELLPPALPKIPHMEIAAVYRPGASEQEAGGDFYDVFRIGPSRWAAVIGDACGKGPEAASLTALARHTLRAVARERLQPSRVLGELNRAILDQRSDGRFITVAFAEVTAGERGHGLTLSNGGHPLPLLLRADGSLEEVGAPGTLIGFYPGAQLADTTLTMLPGDVLVLFTDGLIERSGTEGSSGRWLAAALHASSGAPAAEIAERLRAEGLARGGSVSDDLAMLVMRALDRTGSRRAASDPAPQPA